MRRRAITGTAAACAAVTLGILFTTSLAAASRMPQSGRAAKAVSSATPVVWTARSAPAARPRSGAGGLPSSGRPPAVNAAGIFSAPRPAVTKPLGPAPAPRALARTGKVLPRPAAASTAFGKAEVNGTVKLGPAHGGSGRLLVPAPPASQPAHARGFFPSQLYSSTQIDNFSQQCGWGVNETSVAQSSANPNLLVAGANSYYDNSGNCQDSHAGVFYSSDGGQHWRYEVMPGLIYPASGDPGLTYDPVHQEFLYSFVEFNRSDATQGRIGVEASTDGVNWSLNTTLDSNTSSYGTDKPMITVDQNPSSPHYGRVLVSWTEFFGNNAVYQTAYSDDGGNTWHYGDSAVNETSHECGNGTSPAFNANGEVMVAWADCSSGVNSIYEELSTDGGATWSTGVDHQITTTSPLAGAEDPNPADCFLDKGGSAFRCNSFPSLAGDPNSSDAGGTAFFIVWADVRSTTQSSVTANVSQLIGLTTTDDGSTWGGGSCCGFDFMAFNDFGDKFFPAASFSPSGRLMVSYSSREDSATSTNPNGLSFDEHQTEASSLTNLLADSFISYTTDGTLGNPGSLAFIGDYSGSSSLDNNFDTFPIWTDVRNGLSDSRTMDLCFADCMTFLSPDSPLSIGQGAGSSFTDLYAFSMDPTFGAGNDYWNVVGIREGADGTSVDDDTSLYSNHYYNNELAFSDESPPLNDYTVVNGNSGHAPDTIYFPQVHNFSTLGGPYSIEWDAGHVVIGTSYGDSMAAANVARVYDTLLSTSTQYYFGLRPAAGNTSNYSLNLHSASLGNEQGRNGAVADSGDVSPGSPAFITYNTGSDPLQYDGVVVQNNNGGSGGYTLYRDTAAPSGTISIDGGAAYTNNRTLNLTLSATNPTSGDPVSDMAFSINGGAFGAFQPYSTSAALTIPAGDGLKTIAVEFRNGAGAVGASASSTITLDQTPPLTTASLSGTSTGCSTFWGTVTVTLSATDSGSGVAGTVYQIDGGTLHTYTGPFTVTNVGNNTVTYHSTDKVGNVESTKSTAVNIVKPGLALSPTSGGVGSAVAVTAKNFKSGEAVKVYWDSTSSTALATLTANTSTCQATGTIHVPAAVNGGHTVIAVGQTSAQSANAPFSVTAKIADSPTTGVVGSSVTSTLSGFKGSQSVTLHWGTASGPTLKTVTTNATGGATATWTVPADVFGSHNVYAVGSGGTPAPSTSFSVKAKLVLTPTSGLPNATVTGKLSGFKASQSVTLHWATSGGTVLATVTTNSTGGASITFHVPSVATGTYTVYAVGSGGSPSPTATFTVT